MTTYVVHPIFEKELPLVEDLDTISYAINCVDESSGKRGTFVYDQGLYDKGMGMWAISPLFQDIGNFYQWTKVKGFVHHRQGEMLVISRHPE